MFLKDTFISLSYRKPGPKWRSRKRSRALLGVLAECKSRAILRPMLTEGDIPMT